MLGVYCFSYVTVHNTGITPLLLRSVWVLLSPPIERWDLLDQPLNVPVHRKCGKRRSSKVQPGTFGLLWKGDIAPVWKWVGINISSMEIVQRNTKFPFSSIKLFLLISPLLELSWLILLWKQNKMQKQGERKAWFLHNALPLLLCLCHHFLGHKNFSLFTSVFYITRENQA